MIIHDFYYNESNRMFYVEFSTEEDGDSFYRVLELQLSDFEYYSPEIIDESDMDDLDEETVILVIESYLKENDLPEEQSL
jgi:hypothetical protein